MNYKYETIMSWIMYVKNGIWKVNKQNNYSSDAGVVVDKFNTLFKSELERECNDALHFMTNPYKKLGTISVFVNPEACEFKVLDCYNNLLSFYSGIYDTFDGRVVCLDIKARGYKANYFKLMSEEDYRFVSLKTIINGSAKDCPNVRRVISMLFSRQWPYLESTNPEDFMFMDYSGSEREELIKDCKKCEPRMSSKKRFNNEEEE